MDTLSAGLRLVQHRRVISRTRRQITEAPFCLPTLPEGAVCSAYLGQSPAPGIACQIGCQFIPVTTPQWPRPPRQHPGLTHIHHFSIFSNPAFNAENRHKSVDIRDRRVEQLEKHDRIRVLAPFSLRERRAADGKKQECLRKPRETSKCNVRVPR